MVREFINSHYDGFIHDKPIYTGNCKCVHRRRVDSRKLIDGTLLAIETDERQHSSYKDEDIRYNDLYMAYSGKWIYIRFNPDSYIDKNGKRCNPQLKTRLLELKKMIDYQINRIKNNQNNKILEIVYMYYNQFTA